MFVFINKDSQVPSSASRNGTRDAPPPPPPPARMQSGSSQNSYESRGRPPPPLSSSRQPSSHPPPPPPMRNGHTSASRAFTGESASAYWKGSQTGLYFVSVFAKLK